MKTTNESLSATDPANESWAAFWEQVEGKPTEYDYRADVQLPPYALGVVAAANTLEV